MSQPYEIRASNYPHPDREHGQHTNGPAHIFIRRTGVWYRVTGTHHLHVLRVWIENLGLDAVIEMHCHPIEEPTP